MASRSSTISINGTHLMIGSKNKFEYHFPTAQQFSTTDTISLQEISIYNSFFNITGRDKNNKFSIIWNANTTVQYDFTIPDSFLDVDGINAYLLQQMTLNKLYLIDDITGEFVYYITLTTNASQYASQFYITPLPTSAQATSLGLSIPSGATWTLPGTETTPQILFNDAFGTLLGFTGATYPPAPENILYTKLSNITPQIVSITNVMIGCNFINNEYSLPNNLISAIPINGAIGSLLYFSNASANFSNIHSGTYSSCIISFYDQYGIPLEMKDTNINVLLNIKRIQKI